MSRQDRPVGLIIAVVAVAAAALLLWLIIRSGDDDDGASASSKPPTAPERSGSGPERVDPSVREGPERPGLPQIAEADGARRAGEREPATEVIIDGRRIRDHRKDRSQPIAIAPRPPPEHARKIPPTLTAEISNRMLPIVRECGASVPPEARGAKPRVEGHVVIAIKNQQVQLSAATVDLTDVSGAPVEAAKQCIQLKSLGITAPAADEADLENYPIRVSFSLP